MLSTISTIVYTLLMSTTIALPTDLLDNRNTKTDTDKSLNDNPEESDVLKVILVAAGFVALLFLVGFLCIKARCDRRAKAVQDRIETEEMLKRWAASRARLESERLTPLYEQPRAVRPSNFRCASYNRATSVGVDSHATYDPLAAGERNSGATMSFVSLVSEGAGSQDTLARSSCELPKYTRDDPSFPPPVYCYARDPLDSQA